MAAHRRRDGIFVTCVGRQAHRLWTATMIRTPEHTNTDDVVTIYCCKGVLYLSALPRTRHLPFVQKLVNKVNHLSVMTSKFPV